MEIKDDTLQADSAPLTPRQKAFCLQYIVDLNGTKAAIRAGYSKATADQQASRLLTKVKVEEEIQRLMDERSNVTLVTAQSVIMSILDTRERCLQSRPVLDKFGNQVYVETKNGDLAPAYTFDSKSALKANELLARHLGILKDNLNLSGGVTGFSTKDLPTGEGSAQKAKEMYDRVKNGRAILET